MDSSSGCDGVHALLTCAHVVWCCAAELGGWPGVGGVREWCTGGVLEVGIVVGFIL